MTFPRAIALAAACEVVRQFENVGAGGMNAFIAEEIAHWRAIMKEVGLNPRN